MKELNIEYFKCFLSYLNEILQFRVWIKSKTFSKFRVLHVYSANYYRGEV